jgi:prolyl-tRNA synthetase
MYSFSKDTVEHERVYEQTATAYNRIFDRVGIGAQTYKTYASGGTFSKYSHEFQTLTAAGEDTIYVCETCHVAINEEIIKEQSVCPVCGTDSKTLRTEKAVEVGNIFNLGTKFSAPFDLSYADEAGEKKLVVMGCYGIGLGRVMGTIAEVLSDDKGIIWPASVAPYAVHLVSLTKKPEEQKVADALYQLFIKKGIDVLYDDRPDVSAGEKFADSDLIGIPLRVVVSGKTIAAGAFEVKDRATGTVEFLDEKALLTKLV